MSSFFSKELEMIQEKYPVGSCFKVVKKPEFNGVQYPSPGWNEGMTECLGKVFKVSSTATTTGGLPIIHAFDNAYVWHPNWIEPHCDCPSIDLARTGCSCKAMKREKIKVKLPEKVYRD